MTATHQSPIARLEAALKSRTGWADSIITPFAIAAHKRPTAWKGERPQRRLSLRDQRNDLRRA